LESKECLNFSQQEVCIKFHLFFLGRIKYTCHMPTIEGVDKLKCAHTCSLLTFASIVYNYVKTTVQSLLSCDWCIILPMLHPKTGRPFTAVTKKFNSIRALFQWKSSNSRKIVIVWYITHAQQAKLYKLLINTFQLQTKSTTSLQPLPSLSLFLFFHSSRILYTFSNFHIS